MRAAIAAALILISCGTTEAPGIPQRTCARTVENRIDSEEICMSSYACSQGDDRWFQLHLCLCWDNLCMCFIKRSTSPCQDPLDESCGLTGGMAIIGPGFCSLESDRRNSMLFPEQHEEDGGT